MSEKRWFERMEKAILWLSCGTLLVLLAGGCSDSSGAQEEPKDGGVDADALSDEPEGEAVEDAGQDAGQDAGEDTDEDAGEDSGDTERFWSWRPAASMSVARSMAGAAWLNGMVYIIGGHIAPEPYLTDLVERYDPSRDEWTTVAPMPRPACGFAAAVIGDRIYVAGGYNVDFSEVVADTFSYHPATDSWRNEPDMPTARANPGGCAWNGKFSVAGGRTTRDGLQVTGAIELFDPEAGTWSRLPTGVPSPREAMAVIAAGGDLWVIGGASEDVETSYGMVLTEVYRAGGGRWEVGPELLIPRVGLAGAAVLEQLVVAGGWTPYAHTDTVEMLAPTSGAWTALPNMKTARVSAAVAQVGNELLIAGGWQYTGGGQQTLLPSVEILSWR